MAYNKIDNKKLNVRKTIERGNGIYIPMTGYLEKDKKYVVEVKKTKRTLNNSESFIENKVIIQDREEVKKICQNWNETSCKECDVFI